MTPYVTSIKQHKTPELQNRKITYKNKRWAGRVGMGYEVCIAGEKER